jgi:UDP-N-acetylglucosamine 2-epimerase (non-hydrolysing)
MKIVTVVGARPNFMKVAPIVQAIQQHNGRARRNPDGAITVITHILVHTGQHYDALMSDAFFADLGLPAPDILLGVGSGSHACQTGEVLKRFEEVLLLERPDAVIVVGDVNSTVAAALATAKISFDNKGSRPLLAHVEAGLRSFDRSMPEEVNRVLADHLSDLLFVTERSGCENLRNEGIGPNAVHLVGNTMIDSLLALTRKAEASNMLERLGFRTRADSRSGRSPAVRYALLTLHRPANVDSPEGFVSILDGLEELTQHYPVVFPVHPRTRDRVRAFGLEARLGAGNNFLNGRKSGILMTDPLGYLDFVCLMKNADLVVTDSGGVQEETTALGVPCITVRANTERPVTIELGTNILGGTDKNGIAKAVRKQLGTKAVHPLPEMWDGKAADRIIKILHAALLAKAADSSSTTVTC